MMSSSFECYRCKRALADGEGRAVHRIFQILAVVSLAAVHAGLWAGTILSKNYCASCRKRLSILSVTIAVLMVSLAGTAFWWAISKGLFHRKTK